MYGAITLGADFPIIQSSGAVYGIWASAESPLSPGLRSIPGHPGWYPIYWGKDIAPMSRMKAHVQGHKNGNVNLPAIAEIQGRPLIYGGILVSRYMEFEQLLHRDYIPMRGTAASGKASTVVRIQD